MGAHCRPLGAPLAFLCVPLDVSPVWHLQIHLAGLPVVADFVQNGARQTQQRCFVGEQCGDASPTLDLLVESFEHVRRAKAATMRWRQFEDGQAFGRVGFHPGGKVGCTIGVFFHQLPEQPIRLVTVRRVENAALTPKTVRRPFSKTPIATNTAQSRTLPP